MESFKVICKESGDNWFRDKGLKTTTTKGFFGFFKKTSIGKDIEKAYGPSKDEICIVLDVKDDGYYKLAGYTQHGWYTPEPFIRLDEFTESQKEIAEKAQLMFN